MFKSMTQNVKVYLATLSIIWAIVIAADLIWGKADAELHVMFGLIFLPCYLVVNTGADALRKLRLSAPLRSTRDLLALLQIHPIVT